MSALPPACSVRERTYQGNKLVPTHPVATAKKNAPAKPAHVTSAARRAITCPPLFVLPDLIADNTTDRGAADDFSGFSGTDADGPLYPGEDFVQNAPDGVEFPVDLTGVPIVISVEPAEDNDPAPFALKPLVGEAPGTPMENTPFGAGPAAFSGSGTHG